MTGPGPGRSCPPAPFTTADPAHGRTVRATLDPNQERNPS
jgi:hypothetical protein